MKVKFGHVEPWWDDSFKALNYQYIPIKNTWDKERWEQQGYANVTLNGGLYGMPSPMPDYASGFTEIFDWDNVGIAFYCMQTLDMFPLHRDHYVTYINKYNVTDTAKIWRAIVFLEDWRSGHYAECAGTPVVNWSAGNIIEWSYDTPHMAANLGLEPRYTLQITGHV